MGRLGCTIDGHLNDSRFNQPMPWIGLYVAAASTGCALAMAIDLFLGFRSRKLWFPSNFFSLNATTLTLIGVAVKLSVDLNTSMPRLEDQLAKLTSDVFLSTVIGNSMPSIGTMDNKDMFMNIVALAILVITSLVNVCIQLGTGVIFVFWKEHALVMSLMIVLLTILFSSALSIPTTKSYLEVKYKKKHKLAVKECSEQTGDSVSKRLREGMIKYWIMAHTSSPQFVICRSVTCTASGSFCVLTAIVLAEAMVRSYFIPHSFSFCQGESDYKWSVTLIIITQTLAIVIGTIAPVSRWFTAINYRNLERANKACDLRHVFKVENYWTLKLHQWKEQPISSTIGGWKGRKLTHNVRDGVLDFFIALQTWIVLMCKLMRLISVFMVSRVLICCRCCNTRTRTTGSTNDSFSSSDLDLKRFVTHLQGEEQLVHILMEDNRHTLDHWLEMGERQQPNYLIEFFEKFPSSEEFRGVLNFDSDLVPYLDSEEPPNSWALPLVTLTSIAISLHGVDHDSIKQLTKAVHQGLMYAREVEKNTKKELVDITKAAENIWLGVDLYHKWLDIDLRKLSVENKTAGRILQEFSDIAKKKFTEFKNEQFAQVHSSWSTKVLAANSMYRICETILLDCEVKDNISGDTMFNKLSLLISDILGACLINLGHIITIQCISSAIEERERNVQCASLLLGKMENVLKILERRTLPSTDLDQLAYIDYWRKLLSIKTANQHLNFSPQYSEAAASSSSPNLCINIE